MSQSTIESIYIPKNLYRPDSFGNYWLANDKLSKPHCPVIFQRIQPKVRVDGTTYNLVLFWCSMGGDTGIIWKGTEIQYFDTPQEALEALRKVACQGGLPLLS